TRALTALISHVRRGSTTRPPASVAGPGRARVGSLTPASAGRSDPETGGSAMAQAATTAAAATAIDQPAPTRPRVGLSTLLPYLREHVPAMVGVAVLSLLNAAGTLAQPLLIRQVLDQLGAGEPIARTVALLVGVLVGVAVLYGGRNFLLQRTAEGLVLATRRKLAAHRLRLPI